MHWAVPPYPCEAFEDWVHARVRGQACVGDRIMGRRGIATTGTSFRATGTRADARWSAGTRAGRAGTSSIVWCLSFFPPCNHNINI